MQGELPWRRPRNLPDPYLRSDKFCTWLLQTCCLRFVKQFSKSPDPQNTRVKSMNVATLRHPMRIYGHGARDSRLDCMCPRGHRCVHQNAPGLPTCLGVLQVLETTARLTGKPHGCVVRHCLPGVSFLNSVELPIIV